MYYPLVLGLLTAFHLTANAQIINPYGNVADQIRTPLPPEQPFHFHTMN